MCARYGSEILYVGNNYTEVLYIEMPYSLRSKSMANIFIDIDPFKSILETKNIEYGYEFIKLCSSSGLNW